MTKRYLAMDVLVVGMHEHGPGGDTAAIMRYLREHPSVRSFGTVDDITDARRVLSEEHVNTILIDPAYVSDRENDDYESLEKGLAFIRDVRKSHSKIVFVLYSREKQLQRIVELDKRFRNYFQLNSDVLYGGPEAAMRELDKITDKCQTWHRELFNYDVALSFAGEEREFARQITKSLKRQDLTVFFDEDYKAEFAGADLGKLLDKTYFSEARFCVMLISTAYRDKLWPSHEFRAALDRMRSERGTDYYLVPVIVDDVRLDGLRLRGLVSHEEGAETIARIVSSKTWSDPSAKKRKFGFWIFDRQ